MYVYTKWLLSVKTPENIECCLKCLYDPKKNRVISASYIMSKYESIEYRPDKLNNLLTKNI